MHRKIQAAMREKQFPEEDIQYIGEEKGQHLYLIAGAHIVAAESITEFEQIE